MKLLLFAGAGTSVELGVPAMKGLATEFLTHSEQWDVEPTLVRQMMGDILDIEHLIESLDQICAARNSLPILGELSISLDRVDTIRSEVEWFVQHAAERIAPGDAQLMWGSILRTAKNHELTFVTTNYDRAIELAANAEGVSLTDGFESFGEKEVAPWVGFYPVKGSPSIVKLHGSTDWYTENSSGNPLKLRHPMPLFGRGTLRLFSGQELGSCIVLPSREKLLTRAPYPRQSQAFLNAVDDCDIAVFVGSSLRDPHVREAASTIMTNRPVFIINPEGDRLGLDNAHPIAQPASQFLISTLPAALSSSELPKALMHISEGPVKSNPGILGLLRLALDPQEHTSRRCEVIEQLDEQSTTLDEHLIHKLLSDDDGTVARYALGLVATCPGQDALLTSTLASPHASDSAFAEELALLKQMIG
ncbi:MAG: SIR2 family protein [Candidatus Binatia bacterium]